MCAAYKVEIMPLDKPMDHIRTESKRYTTFVRAPAQNMLARVGPEEVA